MAAEANPSLLRQHAAVILARQAEMREVKRRRQKQGIKGPLPFLTLARLGNEWLAAHPQLIAEAAASPIERRPVNQHFRCAELSFKMVASNDRRIRSGQH